MLAINVPGVKSGEPTLDRKTLVNIYLGQIKKWNDSAIINLNPVLKLPDQVIAMVRGVDGSGPRLCLSAIYTKVNPDWKGKIGAGSTVNWPVWVTKATTA